MNRSQAKRGLHLKAIRALGKVRSRGRPRVGSRTRSMLLGSQGAFREDGTGRRLWPQVGGE